MDSMPEKLRLISKESKEEIKVECLFVEVKSSNDRLDPRQVDWLNILDWYGNNARVCQFVDSNRKPKRKKKAGKASKKKAATS